MKTKGSVIALGMFDGVHLGHRALLASAREIAAAQSMELIVYTFTNHPMTLFGKTPKLLMDTEVRLRMLENVSGGQVVADDFDAAMRDMQSEAFVEMLLSRFNMKAAVAGFNYSFGSGGKGNTAELVALSKKHNFSAHVLAPVSYLGETVSSSRIRTCLENGDVSAANAMLCTTYLLSSSIISNRRIGHTIGFPTANIAIGDERVIPASGVYATRASVKGETYAAVTNIGKNPTVNGKIKTIETHIIDFDGEIYGEWMDVFFHEWLRGDVKFAGIDELASQITKDVSAAKTVLGSKIAT